MSIGNLSAAHTFDYIVLRVGLTNCEDFAVALLVTSRITDHELHARTVASSSVHIKHSVGYIALYVEAQE